MHLPRPLRNAPAVPNSRGDWPPQGTVTDREARAREQQAAVRAVRDADAQAAAALAAAVAPLTRCELRDQDVLPVCALIIAVQRVAARNGVHAPTPDLHAVAETCEDLATRNHRRGYSADVGIGPLAGSLFGAYSPSGSDFGYDSWNRYLRDVAGAMVCGRDRLGDLQHPSAALAAARLSMLAARDVSYCS